MKHTGRRIFIRILLVGIAGAFVLIWNKLTLSHIRASNNKTKLLPYPKNKAVSFLDNYIVINKNNHITVYSAQCPHLGCKINKIENGELVCPCHGSVYDLDGNVTKGPSYKNLKLIPAKITDDGENIEIEG